MTGKGGDYEGWILRMIDKAEDIVHSYSQVDWLKFCADKIEEASGQGITKSQIDTLVEYRNKAFELPEELGFRIVRETRYRDERGRWTRDTSARPVSSTVIRGEGNRFMGKATANGLVRAEIQGLGVRKKEKEY